MDRRRQTGSAANMTMSSGQIIERHNESDNSLRDNGSHSNGSSHRSLIDAYKRPRKSPDPEEIEKVRDSKSFDSLSISEESEK